MLYNRSFRISNDIAAEGKRYLLDNFLPDTRHTDIIIGYRADDSYFSFASGFLNNTLSLGQLGEAMYLGKPGEQTVLKSKSAFGRLRYIRSEAADRGLYYPQKSARDKEARTAFRQERAAGRAADAVYLIDILRERRAWDDLRIRRNLPG